MHDTWINGKPSTLIPASDRGLAYGDGVFETIRIERRQPILATLHWQRLSDSLNRLGIAIDLNLLLTEVQDFLTVQPEPQGVLKVMVTRGSGGRGYNPAGCNCASRILSFHTLPAHPQTNAERGISLFPCQARLGHVPVLAGMKHLNRLENVLARSEWDNTDFQEGLLLDINDRVIEGTMGNLFMVKNGTIITPPLDLCGVSGVCREYILRQSASWGVSVLEQDIDESQLLQADEVFVANSVIGIWPVARYRDRTWSVGAVTVMVRDRLMNVLTG